MIRKAFHFCGLFWLKSDLGHGVDPACDAGGCIIQGVTHCTEPVTPLLLPNWSERFPSNM